MAIVQQHLLFRKCNPPVFRPCSAESPYEDIFSCHDADNKVE